MAVVPKCLLAGSPADSRSTIRDAIRISNDQAAQALPFRGYKALLIRKPTSSETAAAFSNVNHFRISCWSLLPLQLRYLQTLNSISAENNSTIIFPVRIIAIKHHIINNNESLHVLINFMIITVIVIVIIFRFRSTSYPSWWTVLCHSKRLSRQTFSFQFDLTLPILSIVQTLQIFLCCYIFVVLSFFDKKVTDYFSASASTTRPSAFQRRGSSSGL